METIATFILKPLRNEEHFEFMVDTGKSIESKSASVLGVAEIFPSFLEALTRESDTIRVESGSALTKSIQNLEKLRRRTWKSVKQRVDSAINSPFAEEVESGRALKRVLHQYGNVAYHTQIKVSAEINLLVQIMEEPQNAVHLENVNLVRLIPELKKQNDQIKAIIDDRFRELSMRIDGNVKATRMEIDPLYNRMVNIINATVTLGTAQQEALDFIKEQNERIKYNKTTLAIRHAKSKKARKKKEKPELPATMLPDDNEITT